MGDGESAERPDMIGIEEVTSLLEVTSDRVRVMIEGGLLNPVGRPGELRFYRGEVIAAREQGG